MIGVDAELQRIAALPGSGRYELGFRSGDGALLTAVVEVDATATAMRAAPASLPAGWTAGSAELAAVTEAVLALHRARTQASPLPTLRDVPGGWDVSMGNVVLTDGVPHCLAHGPMEMDGEAYVCPGCGARAVLAP
jgi:uncharacterized protein YbdZ (MbtH family)